METIVILLMELLVHYAVAGVGASIVGMAGTVRNGSGGRVGEPFTRSAIMRAHEKTKTFYVKPFGDQF